MAIELSIHKVKTGVTCENLCVHLYYISHSEFQTFQIIPFLRDCIALFRPSGRACDTLMRQF